LTKYVDSLQAYLDEYVEHGHIKAGMTTVDIIQLVIAGAALLLSLFALIQTKRSAKAAEDSARAAERSADEAERGNDIAVFGHLQSITEKFMAEMAKQKALGNQSDVNALGFAFGKLQLEALRKAANQSDEARQFAIDYFRGFAERKPEDKEVIEALLAEIIKV
jgi:hypothetical protein